MKKKGIFIGITLIIFFVLATNANATSDKELADTYYQKAMESYNDGNCVNASELASRALTLYTKSGNEAGRLKTLDLIGDINICLAGNGDSYYEIALRECNKKTYGGYEKCITWARKAREQYLLIPDQLEVSKCENQIKYAEEQMVEIIRGEANGLYNSALELYDKKENMFNTKKKAEGALSKYTEIGDTEGIEKCNALLGAIKIWFEEKTHEAETNYRYASERYQTALKSDKFEDYEKAMDYAKKAQELFDQVNNKEGYAKSRDLITIINGDMGRLEDKFNKEATAHYETGLKELLFGKSERDGSKKREYFNNAKKKMGQARSIYVRLYNWAKELKDYKVRDEKKKRYTSRIHKCDEKLEEIQIELDRIIRREKAEKAYVDANTFFTKGECKKARERVDNASSIFKEISDYSGVSKCDELVKHITECLNKLKSADKYYSKATARYKEADSVNATKYLKKARAGYSEVKYAEGVEKCDSLTKKIKSKDETKKTADKLLSESKILYRDKRYKESKKNAEEAETIYKEIKYKKGISNANDMIKKNNDMIEKVSGEAEETMKITIGVILFAILITISIWWVKKVQEKRKEEQRGEMERKKMGDELRRRREETKNREEQRTKELEAERLKLKAMVEGEKKRLGGEAENEGRDS